MIKPARRADRDQESLVWRLAGCPHRPPDRAARTPSARPVPEPKMQEASWSVTTGSTN